MNMRGSWAKEGEQIDLRCSEHAWRCIWFGACGMLQQHEDGVGSAKNVLGRAQ